MEVVEQGAPGRVVVEASVREAEELAGARRDDRARVGFGVRHALGPYERAVGNDVAVEERIRERAAVVAPPVVGVQRRDGADVVRGRRPNFHAPPMLARQGPTPRRFSPSRAGPGRTRPGQARRRSAGPDAVRSRTGDRGPEVAAA